MTTSKPLSKAEPSSRKPKPLTGKDRTRLRGLGHSLDAVVQIGKTGISRGLLEEVGRALDAHELIKVRILRECPLERDVVAEQIASGCAAAHIQSVGGVLLFYRARPKKPIIELSGASPEPAKTGGKSKAKPQIRHGVKHRRAAGGAHAPVRESTNKRKWAAKPTGARAPAPRQARGRSE